MSDNIKTIEVSMSDVPRYFNVGNSAGISTKDVIAYIRKLIRDPWVPVVISTKSKPVSIEDLEKVAIYWEGINDDLADKRLGIMESYCVIDVSELNNSEEDGGVQSIVNDFKNQYAVNDVKVLIVGDDDTQKNNLNIFKSIRDYIYSNTVLDVSFPSFVSKSNMLLPNGFDISPCAEKIAMSRHRNNLDSAMLDTILKDLQSQVVKGYTAIQDLKEFRTDDVKLLTTYLILKYDLPPVYVSSFIAEYIGYAFIFRREKLSLYEKINFVKRIPPIIGYIGKNRSFNCLAKVVDKLYPKPYYVFDISNGTLVEDISEFDIKNNNLSFTDWRTLFSGSRDYFSSKPDYTTGKEVIESTGLQNDMAVNNKLVDMFSELSKLVDEEIYISVKNSLLVTKDGVRYLMYCPEECGVDVILTSEYVGQFRYLITEEEFNHIIDAQLEAALLSKDRAANSSEATEALVAKWTSIDTRVMLQPAVPFEVILYNELLPITKNGLSFYDRCLRSFTNILPIVSSTDSSVKDINPLFDEVKLASLRKDNQARYAISCCGTIIPTIGDLPILPVTFKAFSGRRLLDI